MNKKLVFLVSFIVLLVLSLPVMAQDEEPLEAVPVSGSFDYTPEIFAQLQDGETSFWDASEDEVWTGDIEGTAVAPFRMAVTPNGMWDAWIVADFDGTVLGEYEGTMVIVSRYKRHAADAHWYGEWIILSGTGDLENVQGYGTAWGPGFNPEDPEAGPDIYYSGEVIVPES